MVQDLRTKRRFASSIAVLPSTLLTKYNFVGAQGDQEHVVVRVQDLAWRVLKRRICQESPVFKNAFENTTPVIGGEKVIELDDDVATVARVMVWLYHDDFPIYFSAPFDDGGGEPLPTIRQMMNWGKDATHAIPYTEDELSTLEKDNDSADARIIVAKTLLFADKYELTNLQSYGTEVLTQHSSGDAFSILRCFFAQHGIEEHDAVRAMLEEISLKNLREVFKDDAFQTWMKNDGKRAAKIAGKLMEDVINLEMKVADLERKVKAGKRK